LEDLEDEDPLDPEVLGIEVQMLQVGRKAGKYGENMGKWETRNI